MTLRSIRVALVVGVGGTPCHPRIDECPLEVVAEVGSLDDLIRAPSHEHEVAIVGCSTQQLGDPRFHTRLARLSRAIPTVLVAPRITRGAAVAAARARTLGLAARGDAPEELTRVIRAVAHGHVAYPQQALTVLLRLLPAAQTRDGSPAPAT